MGLSDVHVLPSAASSRQVGDLLRDDFTVNPVSNVTVVALNYDRYNRLRPLCAALSRVADVTAVSSPSAFVNGDRIGPPTAPTGNRRRGVSHGSEQCRVVL